MLDVVELVDELSFEDDEVLEEESLDAGVEDVLEESLLLLEELEELGSDLESVL